MTNKKILLEFSGGMELLFGNINKLDVELGDDVDSLSSLLPYVRDKYLKGNPELFMAGDSVRPGVLVLINDVDWELEGQGQYMLQNGDNIVFISTLHGG